MIEDEITCGSCGKTMTRQNSTTAPEWFLCDECASVANIGREGGGEMSDELRERFEAAAEIGRLKGRLETYDDCFQQLNVKSLAELVSRYDADVERLQEQVAALEADIRRLLGPVTNEEIESTEAFVNGDSCRLVVEQVLAARRARLLAPVKTVEEQIEESVHALCKLPMGSKAQNDLADSLLALIATLKQEE